MPGGGPVGDDGRVGHLFVFEHVWHVPAASARAYAALADVESYPRWWPEVRSVRRIDEHSGDALVRSVLPYTLHLRLTRDVEDPDGRRLRVRIGGDLEGWARFSVEHSGPSSSCARYRQEVRIGTPFLRHAATLAGPVLRFNHGAMMRSGERGLAALLGGAV